MRSSTDFAEFFWGNTYLKWSQVDFEVIKRSGAMRRMGL